MSPSQTKVTWQDVEANDALIIGVCRKFFRRDWEDAAQRCRLRLWESLSTFRGESKLSTWIHRICFNECLNIVRTSNTKKRANTDSLDEMRKLGFDASSSYPGPARITDAREMVAILRSKPKLKNQLRTIEMLADGASYEELSEIRGITVGTLKSSACRARRALRHALGVKDPQPTPRPQRLSLSDRQAAMKSRHASAGLTI